MAIMDTIYSPSEVVTVPRGLLREVLVDGCCPLHLRLQLSRLLTCSEKPGNLTTNLSLTGHVDVSIEKNGSLMVFESPADPNPADPNQLSLGMLAPQCLANVAAYLPLEAVLMVRACSREPLHWAMQLEVQDTGPRRTVHNRIRTRLWMRRIADVTAGTKDESVFETQMRSLADEALRSRMEEEMQEALAHMEEQIQSFQAEVDRRLDEQERHVRRLVEERVQQELDTILVSEVAKVHVLVEERVRERVSAIFQHEVRETVRELQDRLDKLVLENQTLSEAFAEANFRSKFFFWVLHPPLLQTASMFGVGFGPCSSLSLKRRMELMHIRRDSRR